MTSLPVVIKDIKFDEIQIGDMIEYTTDTPLVSSGGFYPRSPRTCRVMVLSRENGVLRTLDYSTNVFHYLGRYDIDTNKFPTLLLSRAEVM